MSIIGLVAIGIIAIVACFIFGILLKSMKLILPAVIGVIVIVCGVTFINSKIAKYDEMVTKYNAIATEINTTGKLSNETISEITELNEKLKSTKDILSKYNIDPEMILGKHTNISLDDYTKMEIDINKIKEKLKDKGKDDIVLPILPTSEEIKNKVGEKYGRKRS